jgi:peptidoglycan/xylan/chitin deacetylase (PgdA/CDA1 family)
MVFMGGTLRLSDRESFSNPDRSAELFLALPERAAKSLSRPRVSPPTTSDGRCLPRVAIAMPCAVSRVRVWAEYNVRVTAVGPETSEAVSPERWARSAAAARPRGRRGPGCWLGAVLAVAAAFGLGGCGGRDRPQAGAAARAKAPRARRAPRTDPAAIAARANVPVLCWHQIRPTSIDGADARPYIVSPRRLAAQLDALDRAGFTPVSGDALASHVVRGTPLPPKPVLLTFDDGSAGQYTRALPILRRHHFVATFFVMTVVLDKPGWLSSGEVRALDRAGMTIGAHTWDHRPVPQYTDADWSRQLIEPRDELAGIVGHPVRLFAYPFGLWSIGAFAHLRGAGFIAAFQLADKLDRADARWTLRRIIVPSMTGAQLLRAIRQDF